MTSPTTVRDVIAALSQLPPDMPFAVCSGGPYVSPVTVVRVSVTLDSVQDRNWDERDKPAVRPREPGKPFVYREGGETVIATLR